MAIVNSRHSPISAFFAVPHLPHPTIGLDPGQHAAQAVGTTRSMMVAGPDYLSYELYQDASRSTVWANSGVSLFTPAAAPNKNPRSFNIYGWIPAGQGSTIGNYTDTVVATVNF